VGKDRDAAMDRVYGADIDNLRGALEWAFGPDGDITVGLDLVAHSHVLWAELGLMLNIGAGSLKL